MDYEARYPLPPLPRPDDDSQYQGEELDDDPGTHKLRKIRPGSGLWSGPKVCLACDTCRTACVAKTREGAKQLHDDIAADPERLEKSRVKDEQFWLENYHS